MEDGLLTNKVKHEDKSEVWLLFDQKFTFVHVFGRVACFQWSVNLRNTDLVDGMNNEGVQHGVDVGRSNCNSE
jgi:hypothetical protein